MSQEATEVKSINTLWDELVAAFPTNYAIFYLFKVVSGINRRNKRDRLARFLEDKNAKKADRVIEGLSDKLLCDLYIRAGVNYEQAREAMKLNILVNITFPVALLVGLFELTDGSIIEVAGQLFQNELTAVYAAVGLAFSIAATLITYSYATTMAAKDLKDYLKIKVSEQSDTPTFL